jgi:3-dehydroquinate synthase
VVAIMTIKTDTNDDVNGGIDSSILVDLGERSYSIYISPGILSLREKFEPHIESGQVLIVSNEKVYGLYGKTLQQALEFCEKVNTVILPDGEQYKNLQTLNLIFDNLLSSGFNRKVTLVALGGGVVGDMTGFAAACYQRGVNFIQVPTTLLAQVDSSVGGKTGVNHALGKNMIGAFYQPKCVVIDSDVLNTLSDREMSAGLAEVIKYGLIYDEPFFSWLQQNVEGLKNKEKQALVYAIKRSCEIKAEVVAKDEREGGLRAILNLGHTFGHAIEADQGYGVWLHGEAVGVGMVMACNLSARLGWLDSSVLLSATDLISRAGLPTSPPEDMSTDAFMKYMAVDKKVLDKTLRLVLLTACGNAVVTSDFSSQALMDTLVGSPL